MIAHVNKFKSIYEKEKSWSILEEKSSESIEAISIRTIKVGKSNRDILTSKGTIDKLWKDKHLSQDKVSFSKKCQVSNEFGL